MGSRRTASPLDLHARRNGSRYRLGSPAAALALVVLTACSEGSQPLRLGAAVGAGSRQGLELAVEEINAAGGIGGRRLELLGPTWAIGGADAHEGLRWAERFSRTPGLVAAIHSDSATTLATAGLYNQQRVPQLVTIATHPAITSIGEWTYRLCLSDAEQGPLLARHAVAGWGKRRIAVFYVNDDYGRGLADRFEEEVRRLGAEIVASVFHRNDLRPDDQLALSTRIGELPAVEPDLIFLVQRVQAANWTVRAIREAGLEVDVLGADAVAMEAFLETDPELKPGIRVSQFLSPPDGEPRRLEFIRAYQDAVGRPPDYGAALAYDAARLLQDAVAARGASRRGVKGYLDRLIAEGTTVRGVAGPYRLTASHDAVRPFYIGEIRNGRFELLSEVQRGAGDRPGRS